MFTKVLIVLGLGGGILASGCEFGPERSTGILDEQEAAAAPISAPLEAELEGLREAYRRAMGEKLAGFEQELGVLEARATLARSRTTRAEMGAHVREIRARRREFLGELGALGGASVSTWEGERARLDQRWAELEALVGARTSNPTRSL